MKNLPVDTRRPIATSDLTARKDSSEKQATSPRYRKRLFIKTNNEGSLEQNFRTNFQKGYEMIFLNHKTNFNYSAAELEKYLHGDMSTVTEPTIAEGVDPVFNVDGKTF